MSEDHAKTVMITVSVVSLTATCVALYNFKQKQRQVVKERIREQSDLVPPRSRTFSNGLTRRLDPREISDLDQESKNEPDAEPTPTQNGTSTRVETSRRGSGRGRRDVVESTDYRELYEARLDRVSFLEEELRQAHLRLFNAENLSVSYQARITALQNENESYIRFMEAEMEALKERFEEERIRFRDELDRVQDDLEEARRTTQLQEDAKVELSVESEQASSQSRSSQQQLETEPLVDMAVPRPVSEEEMAAPPPISLTTPSLFPIGEGSIDSNAEEERPAGPQTRLLDAAVIASIVAFIAAW